MNTETIAKIYLTAYENIPRMIKSLDKCVDHAVMSGLGCSHIYSGITTDMLYDKIIVFKNRQDILATIQQVTKDILLKMKQNNAEVLYLKYIKKHTYNEIAIIKNISLRSVFRYVNNALSEFCYFLKIFGYDDDTWFRGELFLEGIYEQIMDSDMCEQNKSAINKEHIKTRAKQNLYYNLDIIEPHEIIQHITSIYAI